MFLARLLPMPNPETRSEKEQEMDTEKDELRDLYRNDYVSAYHQHPGPRHLSTAVLFRSSEAWVL